MKTIIINGQRELAELPELWYTDGTEEANEWGEAVVDGEWYEGCWNYVGTSNIGFVSTGSITKIPFEDHTYITPSEFLRLVYEPWKESQKVKLPSDYDSLFASLFNKTHIIPVRTFAGVPKHINACIQLTNIMNFANDAFEGDGKKWEVDNDGDIAYFVWRRHPIRFTSQAAAKWAYKTFPEIFKAYWNV